MSNNKDYTLIDINNNSKILTNIVTFFNSFHTGTHISYVINSSYPIFKDNTYLYLLYYSTDIFTHLGVYKLTGNRLYLYTFYWHLLKLFDGLFDKYNLLRKSKINKLEALIYLSGFLGLRGDYYYKLLGFYSFILAKSFKLTW